MWQAALIFSISLFAITAEADKTATTEQESPPAAASATDKPWQKCLKKICGSDFGRQNREEMAHAKANATSLYLKYWDIKGAASAAARAELIEERGGLQNLLQMIREDRVIKDVKALELWSALSDLTSLSKLEYAGDYSVDKELSLPALKKAGLSDEQIQRTINAGEAIVKVRANSPIVIREPLDLLRNRFSDEGQLRFEVLSVWRAIDSVEKEVANHFDVTRDMAFSGVADFLEINTRIKDGSYSALDLEKLNDRYVSAMVFQHLIKEKKGKAGAPLRIRDLVKPEIEKAIETRLEGLNSALGSPPAGDFSPTEVAIGDSCLSSAVSADLFFPTKSQYESFAPTEIKWRKDFAEKLKSKLSGETIGRLGPFFVGARAVAGRTIEKWKDESLSRLNREKAESEESAKSLAVAEARGKEMDALVHIHEILSPSDDYTIAEDTQKICSQIGNVLSDEADSTLNLVRVGALTVKYPEAFRSVTFHEYAHLVSGFLRQKGKLSSESGKSFNKWRQCLKDRHEGSSQYLEEDFADLLAGLDDSNLRFPCWILNEDSESYFTLKHPENDGHSSRLFRLFTSETRRGNALPEVCNQALAEKGETFTSKNCFE